MEDYNKFIESLGIKFLKASNINILQSVTVEDYIEPEDSILIVNRGEVKFGQDNKTVLEGEMLFLPGGRNFSITYGTGKPKDINNEEFFTKKKNYFRSYINIDSDDPKYEDFTYVTFEAKVFDSVNFFASLDIPPFILNDPEITSIINRILKERSSEIEGKDRVIKLSTDHLVIEIVRYIIKHRLFVEQLATNSTYFKDPRLIDIFNYIKENVGGDLSNKTLAGIANVSEDYVGQYFKLLTGINPQDYIEYQRMEEAVKLLRTTKKSIRVIGKEVGYKDTAYFCRRFKMMFGIPAGKMRRRETLMNL